MENIKIGRIVNAVALRGAVKVYNYSDYRERYEELKSVIIDGKEVDIEKVRYQQENVILKLKGINDRNTAEALKNKDIFIKEADLRELPEDTFYIMDLIGMKVINTENESEIGIIGDVLQNSAQDVYVIERDEKSDVLIPAVSEFVKEVNLKQGFIRVKVIEGMVE